MKKNDQQMIEDVLSAALGHPDGHVPGTRPELAGQAAAMAEQLAPLLLELPQAEPPEGLFAGIEEELDALENVKIQSIRSDEGAWDQVGDKIWRKVLARDDASGRLTFFLRCEAGAIIPGHFHKRAEHFVIVEGELWINDRLHRAGDAQIAMPESVHPDLSSPSGCLVIVTC